MYGNLLDLLILCQVNIKVEAVFALPSGNYAIYQNSKGSRRWTKDLGYSPGDSVEIMHDKSGKPIEVTINKNQKP